MVCRGIFPVGHPGRHIALTVSIVVLREKFAELCGVQGRLSLGVVADNIRCEAQHIGPPQTHHLDGHVALERLTVEVVIGVAEMLRV